MYSDYLMKIIKSTGSADKLKLAFNNDYPLIIEPEYIEKLVNTGIKWVTSMSHSIYLDVTSSPS